MDVEKHEEWAHKEHTAEEQLARIANQEEHELGKMDAIRQNPKCFAWCLYAVFTVLLVSFENQAAGIVISIPQFRKDFGRFYEGNYVLDANWQSAFSGGAGAALVIGALIAGEVADLIGRRNSLVIGLIISTAGVTMEFVSTTNELFFGGKFVNGFAVGIMQATAASYIGEIVPLVLRGLMTCLIALAFTVGPFIVALLMDGLGGRDDRWAYRSIFCAQYGFAGVAALFVFFMPESPWWLIGKGKDEKALDSLHRLGYTAESGEDVKRVATIKLTLEEVSRETQGATYLECFRKSNLRRTLVSIAPMIIQQFTGIVFAASYGTYYAQLAGYSTKMSFRLQITQQVLSMVGNVISWYLIDKVGRRGLTLYGTIVLTAVLWVMGGLAVGGSVPELKGAVALILIYCFLYNVSIGATAYTCLTETATSRLRIKTVAIGIASANSLGVMWSFVLPYLFNPDKANLGGKVGFIFGGLCFPAIFFIWWFQPETRGRSYEELDEMFMKKIPARKFDTYQPEAHIRGEEVKRAVVDAENAQ